MDTNWQSRVYRKSKGMNRIQQEQWNKLRWEVLTRDQFTCYRCDKCSQKGRGLTPHHIIPRSQGGLDDPDNLITLCDPCHNYIELEKIYNLEQIYLSYEDAEIIESRTVEDSFLCPDWHTWVYGGMKRPDTSFQ